ETVPWSCFRSVANLERSILARCPGTHLLACRLMQRRSPLRSVAGNHSIVVSLFFGRPISAPCNTFSSICFNSFLVLSSMVKSPSTICSSDGRVAYPFLLRPDARKNGHSRPLDCHLECPLCRWSSAPRVRLAGMPEKRQHSRRFGSHLGNRSLSVTKRA